MPLVRFEVRNEYGLGDRELYRGASKRDDSKALLDGVAVAGLVGILRQLGDLAEFAADIFQDLHEQVMVTTARGHKMLTRIQQIEESLPSLEKSVESQTSHIHFAYVAGTDWRASLSTEKNLLLSSDLPRFMLDSYEECRDPPRLYLLDKFDTGGSGACLKRYSDPSYFKRVMAASELTKSAMVQRDNKPRKNKRKGSQYRNGEVKHTVMSRHNSGMPHASPSTGSQKNSAENISFSDTRSRPELASGSTSFNSKTRLSFVEQVSDTSPSMTPDKEYNEFRVPAIQIDHSGSCASVLQDEPHGAFADGDSRQGSTQGQSPFVRWDEKVEIFKPTSSKLCEDVLRDKILNSNPLPAFSEPSNMTETSKNGALEMEEILLDIPNASVSLSGGNPFDEVASETDNYMDARNTLESEAETDSEYQTKREVKSLSNFRFQGMESRKERVNGVVVNPDSSDIEAPIVSHSSLKEDVQTVSSNLCHSNSSESAEAPTTTGFSLDVDASSGNGFFQNVPNISEVNGLEANNCDLSPELSISNSETIPEVEITGDMFNPSGSSPENSRLAPTKFWTNGGLLGVEPSKPPDFSVPGIANQNVESDSIDNECDLLSNQGMPKLRNCASYEKTATLIRPSDTDTISRNFSYIQDEDRSTNTSNSVDQRNLNSNQPFGVVHNVAQPCEPYKCSPSVSVNQNYQEYAQTLSVNQLEKTQVMTSNRIQSVTGGPSQKKTNIFPGDELPEPHHIEPQSYESFRNTEGISSGFSGLAQKFLSNTLQRKVSSTHANTPTPPGVMNANIRSSRTPRLNKQIDNEKIEKGSLRKSIFSSSRFSEGSSPPLEHMKISFHPMNGSVTSKLKLEFPSGNLHDSNEDLMFPSFKLLPGPALPSPDSGSESDDDTFCRSCPYSSEDILSPRSYSNSEVWEKDERSESKEHDIHDVLRRISSSTASSCNFMGFEPRSESSAIGFDNFDEDGTISFQSDPIVDLPGLENVISSRNQWEGQCDLLSIHHSNSALKSSDELPPPPPLPPMQWRVMKSSFASRENNGSSITQIDDSFDAQQAQIFSVVHQQEQTSHGDSRSPCISEVIPAHSNKENQDQKKLSGNTEPNHEVNSIVMNEREALLHQIQNMHEQKKMNGHKETNKMAHKEDEREDLLHQIRNKSFNLRRTVAAKPTIMPQPTTNVSVTAILEKANAIRQAFVGSDEGGDDIDDDDNWGSD